VRSPNGNGYHYGDNVLFGEFAFTAAESGDYSACFSVAGHTPDTVTVEFVWKTGIAAKEWNNGGGRKNHIDVSLVIVTPERCFMNKLIHSKTPSGL